MVELVYRKYGGRKLDPIVHQQRLDLYSLGLSDSEIAEVLEIGMSAIKFWRESVQLKSNGGELKKVTCKLCGKEELYTKIRRERIYCSDCKKDNMDRFYTITDIRRNYYQLAETDTNLAEQLRVQMVREEGKEFTNMVLDGIIEKVRKRKGDEVDE